MSTFLTVAFILLSIWLIISLILNAVPVRRAGGYRMPHRVPDPRHDKWLKK